MALVGVTNYTGQARFFYVVAEVPALAVGPLRTANNRCGTGWRRMPSAGFCAGTRRGSKADISVARPYRK